MWGWQGGSGWGREAAVGTGSGKALRRRAVSADTLGRKGWGSHVVIWGKSLVGRASGMCKGPEGSLPWALRLVPEAASGSKVLRREGVCGQAL